MGTKRIILRPIGWVENKVKSGGKNLKWQKSRSRVVLVPELKETLDGIEEYSHLVVLFWMDKVGKKDRSLRKIVPYGLVKAGKKGVLATRMPQRPNPIGWSIVKLVKRDGNILEVLGLDAFHRTPVLDIKPYTGHPRDLVFKFKTPELDLRPRIR